MSSDSGGSNHDVAINELIWMSVKPLIKLVIPAAAGVGLTLAGLFPVAASRGASQIILNVTLPALLASKIINSFNPSNIAALGPIFLVGIVYMAVSMVFGCVLRATCRVPGNFRWGLLSAATWSNWGDLPTAVVQTVAAGAPFVNGQRDADLAVAYVAIFILLFFVTLFPLRGVWFIQRDYTHPGKDYSLEDGPDGDQSSAERSGEKKKKMGWARIGSRARNGFVKAGRSVTMRHRRRNPGRGDTSGAGLNEKEVEVGSKVREPCPSAVNSQPTGPRNGGMQDLQRINTSRSASVREVAGAIAAAAPDDTRETPDRKLSFGRAQLRMALAERERLKTIVGSPAGSVFGGDGIEEFAVVATDDGHDHDEDDQATAVHGRSLSLAQADDDKSHNLERSRFDNGERDGEGDEREAGPDVAPRSLLRRIGSGLLGFLRSLATPPTISLLVALVCALVDRLKALFVYVPTSSFHPTAPDGQPPLAILLDTAAFLGSASVPLGLIVLGSALARMSIPRPISRWPLASIVSLAFAKLVLLPIVGFFLVQGLTKHTDMVDEDNKVLRFVLIYFSCVPTATTQVALTQIYAPEDGESNSDILAAYIIVQYIVFVFSSVILTAVTLSNIF